MQTSFRSSLKRFPSGLRQPSRLFASQADGLGTLAASREPYHDGDDAGDGNALGGMFTRRTALFKPWQKVAVAVGSALGAFMDPSRADLIAALGETTGNPAFRNMLTRMKECPEGRQILARRPRVTSTSVGHAWDLPDNTFGAAYAKFMGKRNFSPDDRPPVRFMDCDELAYVATRAREVHDFWHVLFKLPTNLIGESALKMLEFQQLYLPMCFIAVVGGTIRLKSSQRDLFIREYLPWAIKAGRNSKDLMCIYYEDHFHEDLNEVRNKWGILPAPSFRGSKTTQ